LRPTEEEEHIIIYVIVVAVVANAAVAIAIFARANFVMANFGEVSLPRFWTPPVLAALQAAGAAGLLLGLLGVPAIGIAAAAGLVLFFVVAVTMHLRAGAYKSLPSPVFFLGLAVAALVMMVIR
jgi:hypothetical protein